MNICYASIRLLSLCLACFVSVLTCKSLEKGRPASNQENDSSPPIFHSEVNADEPGPSFGFPLGELSAEVIPWDRPDGLALSGIVNGYSRYLTKLLGDGHGTALRYSPKYRFRYYDNGFSPQTSQAIEEMRSKLLASKAAARSRGVPEATINEFEAYTLNVAGNPNGLGNQIDEAYEEVQRKWFTCGGQFERVAKSVNVARMTVTVQPAPFYICGTNAGCTWAAAMQNGTNPAQVHASIVYIGGWDSQPTKSWLISFKNLVRWEFGNWLGRLAGHRPRSVAEEYGDKPPCGYSDDRTPPVLKITSPANYSTVSNNVSIKINASDNLGVRDIQFLVNNVAASTDKTAPYEFSWNSATVPNGNHTITVIATDLSGLTQSTKLILRTRNRAVLPK